MRRAIFVVAIEALCEVPKICVEDFRNRNGQLERRRGGFPEYSTVRLDHRSYEIEIDASMR